MGHSPYRPQEMGVARSLIPAHSQSIDCGSHNLSRGRGMGNSPIFPTRTKAHL